MRTNTIKIICVAGAILYASSASAQLDDAPYEYYLTGNDSIYINVPDITGQRLSDWSTAIEFKVRATGEYYITDQGFGDPGVELSGFALVTLTSGNFHSEVRIDPNDAWCCDNGKTGIIKLDRERDFSSYMDFNDIIGTSMSYPGVHKVDISIDLSNLYLKTYATHINSYAISLGDGAQFNSYFFTYEPVVPDSSVPESPTWLVMIAGFGIVGALLRQRQVAAA